MMCRHELTARLEVLISALLKSCPAENDAAGRINRLFDRIYQIPWVYEMVEALGDPGKALALILKDQEFRVSLLAKAVPGRNQLALKDFRGEFGKAGAIQGGAIIQEEELCLILYVVDWPKSPAGKCKSAATASIEPGWHIENLNAA